MSAKVQNQQVAEQMSVIRRGVAEIVPEEDLIEAAGLVT